MATAPVVITATREVPAGAGAVFAVVVDHEHWPEWFPRVQRVQLTGQATGVGGQRRVSVGGVTLDEVFIGWEPDRLFAFTVTDTSRRLVKSMAESVRIEPLGDDRCRVTYTQAIEPTGWTRPLIAIARPQVRKALAGALDNLAERAQSATR